MKTALITGANRGIGYAIAEALNSLGGHRVLLGCRREEDARHAAATLAGHTCPVHLDLSDPSALHHQTNALLHDHGPVDVLINIAGVLAEGTLLEVADDPLAASLQVNFLAPLQLIRALAPSMNARAYGRIVNISSGWGSFAEGLDGPGAYAVSKAALNALTLSLSKTLAPNVKINAMCPGWVHTRMGGAAAPLTPAQGADTAVWLATLPPDGPTGGFFRERRPIAW